MDTNTEPQINSFAGGLNSDDDLSVVATNQYIDARNIKISSYRGGEGRDNRHGSLMPVQGVKLAGSFAGESNKVVVTGSIRDYGVVVCIDENKNILKIYSFKNAIGGTVHDQDFNNIQNSRLVVDAPLLPLDDGEKYPDTFDIQLNYESENNIKLYLADSIHPIMVFNINSRDERFVYTDLDKCLSYPEAVCKPPVFEEYVSGKIEFGVVSYCYQLYNRYGIHTGASIQCQQIPIGNYDFDSKYVKCGGKQGAISNCGVKISIQIPSNYWHLDYIKVFRVQYTQNGQMPIVSVIYDAKINFDEEHDSSELVINDVGNDPIEHISVEELNSLQGVKIIPNSLASKDGFLFAANTKTIQTTIKDFDKWDARAFRFDYRNKSIVTDVNGDNLFIIDAYGKDIEDDSVAVPPFDHDCYDDTYNNINEEATLSLSDFVFDSKYQWVGGSGKNIEWRFVISSQVEDSCVKENNTRKIGTLYNYSQKENVQQNNVFYIDRYFDPSIIEKAEFDPGINKNTWLIKSLRRNEIYRYGIVLYDKYCQASPVKWIADIRTPDVTKAGFQLMSSNTIVNGRRYELVIRNLGIQFMVKSLPEGCTGYQIVRCARHESDIATISQGVLSSPVSNAYSRQFEGNNDDYWITKYHMFCPTGFLTTNKFIEGYNVHNQLVKDGKDSKSQCMTNIDNDKLLQFVSKEICYQPESFKQFTKDKKYYLQKQSFLFGARGDHKFRDDQYDSTGWGHNFSRYDYGPLVGYNKRTSFKFIIPCISNCAVELFTGPGDNGDGRGEFYVNNLTINDQRSKESTICYLDAPFNPSYFYKVNPQSHKNKGINYINHYFTATIGGLGDDRPYSYALAKDCILNFDRLYNSDDQSANDRKEKSGKFIIQKAFAYIKLYEQGIFVEDFCIPPDDWFSFFQKNYIQDFQLVDQIKWDQAFKRNFNNDNKEQMSSKSYPNYAVSAGGALFVNMITGGICNDSNFNILESFGNYNGGFRNDGTGTHGDKNACFGTGGKCLLLSCWYKEKGTAGALSYRYPENGNYYDRLSQEINDTSKPFRPTLLGTYLTNLRQQTTPYGGYSFTNRLTNIYYGDGNYFESINKWNTVFDGDCHVETFEYTSMHKVYGTYTKDGSDNLQFPNTHMITYSIPTESNIWCKFQHGWTFSSNARDNYASFIQAEPCEITEAYVQKDPEYVYNSVYSVYNTSVPLAAYDDLNPQDYNKTIDTRVYYSDLKQNDEIIDSWCKFRSSNFIDVDQEYGPITDICTFKNVLTFLQEQSFGVLSVNDRSVATDNSGQNIVLGTGGVLDRYDYYSNTYGMHKQQFCSVCTTGGLYWFDSHNNVICLFDGQSVVQLSKQGKVQNILNKYKKNDNFKVFYNNRYNEVVFNVLSDDMQIVYNEMLGKFTSTLTIPFDGAIQFFNGEYLVKKNDTVCVYQYDYLDESPKSTNQQLLSSYVKYVVAQQPLVTKVFDNQEIVTYENLQLQDVIYDQDGYFSKNHKYTWQTESQKIESSLEEQITLRENNHRFVIPRADGLFGNRARGKVMICSIEDIKPNPAMAIQYIITKYRQSWS